MAWQPISTAPKDCDLLVWYDHDADPYHDPDNPLHLTDYGANAEGGDFLDGEGIAVARWQPAVWERVDEYGSGYWLPAGWFSRGDCCQYETVCNATHWWDFGDGKPIPDPPEDA